MVTTEIPRAQRFFWVFVSAVVLGFFGYSALWAKPLEDSLLTRPDVVQTWSSEVEGAVERRVSEAERAQQLLEKIRQADLPALNGGISPSTWPRAYTDVLYQEVKAHGLLPRVSVLSPSRLTFAEPLSGWSSEASEISGRARGPAPTWRDQHNQMRELERIVLPILRREGLPAEFLAIPLIESGLNPWVESPKGARGLWQLMPETARRFGLNPDGPRDERLDPVRSTVAAARYLKELYRLWGDWSLALAAYNTGEGRVQQALERGRARDFSTLAALRLLPEETRQYVPAVLAAARQIHLWRTTAGPVPSGPAARK